MRKHLSALGISSHSPISVRVGLRSVHLLQLESMTGSPAGFVTASATIAGGENREAAVSEALKSCLKNGRFRGRDAVLCLSGEDVLIQHQRVSLGEGEEFSADPGGSGALFSRIRDQLRLNTAWDLEETVTRFVPAGGKGDPMQGPRREVIVVAVKRSLIDFYLKIFGSLRLNLLRIGVEPFALRKAILEFCPGEWTGEGPTGVLNIGESRVEIMVIDRGRVSFIRTLPLGIDRLTESISRRMNIDREGMARIIAALGEGREVNDNVRRAVRSAVRPEMEFLATEILTCFRYFSATNPNASVGKIIAFGNGVALLVGRRFIEERLRIPVRLYGVDMPKEKNDASPLGDVLKDDFAALSGLLLEGRAAGEPGIDFLPTEVEERRLRRKIIRLRALYLVIALALMGMYYLKSGERMAVLSNLNEMYQNRCSLLEVTSREVKTLDAETRKIRECGEKLKETASPVLATRLLAEIACVAGPDISFNKITSSYSFASKTILLGKRRKRVPDLSRPVLLLTLEGTAMSAEDVSSFVERLKKTGAFTSIRDEGSWDLRQSGMELKQFTIKVAVGGGGED